MHSVSGMFLYIPLHLRDLFVASKLIELELDCSLVKVSSYAFFAH